VLLDEEAAAMLDEQSGELTSGVWDGNRTTLKTKSVFGNYESGCELGTAGDSGGASRFFYTAKASSSERGTGNNHPTVKPLDLMNYLLRLVTPPAGGVFLDPFMGSGTTLISARWSGQRAVGCELEEKYCEIAANRLRRSILNPKLAQAQLFTEAMNG
jgi:site-specific DNA-methyltransferase (adenine-specific)